MMTPPPVIRFQNVAFSFNGRPVLRDVSFDIDQKAFLAVIGPNGGGKTTLLKLLLGLFKPDHGSIHVFGQPPEKVAHRIGYVPQDVAAARSFPISVMDVVLMGRLRLHGHARVSASDRAAARNALEELEMLEYVNRRIDDLSGGQRERVFIARALATDPDILILDEPTTGLDNTGRADLYALLKKINQTKTVIMASHDIMVLSTYATAVACVNRTVHFHDEAEITEPMMAAGYGCPVELVAHGIPHRILKTHED
jgi:zinc transport system ATP-binding protein